MYYNEVVDMKNNYAFIAILEYEKDGITSFWYGEG